MAETLYAYAFFAAPSSTEQIESIQGLTGSIQVLVAGTIGAAVEPLSNLKYLESDEILLHSALRHDQVICQLFNHLQVLPLRFGTCFISRPKLADHLLNRQTDYQQALHQLSGRAEYLLKAFFRSERIPVANLSAASGTDYLLARKQHYLEQQRQQAQVEQDLAALQALWSATWPGLLQDSQGDEQHRQYFLLSTAQYQQALDLSQEWLEHHPDWQLEWSTALPPYHFVQISTNLTA